MSRRYWHHIHVKKSPFMQQSPIKDKTLSNGFISKRFCLSETSIGNKQRLKLLKITGTA